MTCEAAEEITPASLWEEARVLLRRLLAVCGTPCALIAEVWLSAKERRDLAFRLRPVEELVRRLLVVEAVRLVETVRPVKKGKRKSLRRPAPRAPFCRVAFPDPEDSAGWSVRFTLLPPTGKPSEPRGVPEHLLPKVRDLGFHPDVLVKDRLALDLARHRERHRERFPERDADNLLPLPPRPKRSRAPGNPWPLAMRIEAVRRVMDNPTPYARRLARRLRSDPARVAEACRPPPERPPGRRPRYGEETLRLASGHALAALAPFDTS